MTKAEILAEIRRVANERGGRVGLKVFLRASGIPEKQILGKHVHFVKMMSVLMGFAILSSLAWLVLIRSRVGTLGFLLLALGTLAYISVLVLTRTVNVPINNQLMMWSVSSPPPDVMKIWARREQVHTVRTFIAVFGFACEVLAFGVSTNGPAA